jgi:hypothetical protein
MDFTIDILKNCHSLNIFNFCILFSETKKVRNGLVLISFKLSLKTLFFLVKYAFKHQKNFFPIIKSLQFFFKKIRISVAAILLFEYDEKYVLIKNHHRPELYGPIGGVYKHTGTKPEILDKIEWNSDYTSNELKEEDMKDDLRGIIQGKYFPEFIDWFVKRKGRENEQCLYRELREELLEGRVGKILRDNSSKIKIELFRSVLEGPNKIKHKDYQAQFRWFDIYKIDNSNNETDQVVKEIVKRASQNDNNMIFVTKKEIFDGRLADDKHLISAHAKYYFSSEWHGQEPTKYRSNFTG